MAAKTPFGLGLGKVDIKPLKTLLASEMVDGKVWDPNRGNVDMFRRGHDAWGVRKAMFLYCDDAVERVLAFPWWHRRAESASCPAWREAIVPIFRQLQIPEKHVVRLLLASMEPGVVIPIHHDTGEWVNQMHRVHVALQTNPNVRFLVGHQETEMHRMHLPEGEAFELNNACKHAVWYPGGRDPETGQPYPARLAPPCPTYGRALETLNLSIRVGVRVKIKR